jgi:Tfp pilus assembly protein PilO
VGRFTEKQLTIMTIVVSVVIAGLFAFLIYQDLQTVDQEKQEIENLTAQIRQADQEAAKMPGREADVIVYREIVQRDAEILPNEAEINDFITRIGEFEKISGVVVTEVKGLKERTRGRKGAAQAAIIKIPLKLKVRGSTDQFLRFINLFENFDRFVKISGFSLMHGRVVDSEGNLQHEINLELETYQYNPRGGEVARVDIPNYDRRKAELAIRKRISSFERARIDKYTLKPKIGRRDPLLDPREAERPVEADPEDYEKIREEQRQLLNKLILEIAFLKDDVAAEARLKEDYDLVRLVSVGKAIDQRISTLDYRISTILNEGKFTIPELREEFSTEVIQPYEKIKEDRKTEINEILISREQVWSTLKQMQDTFEEGEYRNVIQLFEGFLRVSDGRKLDPEAEPLRETMDQLARQAEVITKFESEPLNIEGVIIDRQKSSFAIINGSIYSEGDYVDGDRKIRIKEIKQDQIVFEYQEVLIRKHLDGK